MKIAHTWLLGLPLLVGSMVLAHAAFVPAEVEPVQVIHHVDASSCGNPPLQAGYSTGGENGRECLRHHP